MVDAEFCQNIAKVVMVDFEIQIFQDRARGGAVKSEHG
jgi:hypothetical protein